jgi:hypothetical protein
MGVLAPYSVTVFPHPIGNGHAVNLSGIGILSILSPYLASPYFAVQPLQGLSRIVRGEIPIFPSEVDP